MHMFSNILHRRHRVSPKRPKYLLIVESDYCDMRFAHALHMSQNPIIFPCLYTERYVYSVTIVHLNHFFRALQVSRPDTWAHTSHGEITVTLV